MTKTNDKLDAILDFYYPSGQVVSNFKIDEQKAQSMTLIMETRRKNFKQDIEALIKERELEARNDCAGDIYRLGMDIIMQRPAAAIVVGGTDLDKLLRQLERLYGKDLIQHIYGIHNKAELNGGNKDE